MHDDCMHAICILLQLAIKWLSVKKLLWAAFVLRLYALTDMASIVSAVVTMRMRCVHPVCLAILSCLHVLCVQLRN